MQPARNMTLALVAALIVLAGAAARILSLHDDSLWSDEAFTVFFVDAPAGDFVDRLLVDGVHVPLYFALMRLLPTGSDFLLRLPCVLLGVGGIALLIGITLRLYRDCRLALWAGALLAFNPYHVWFSRMARPYALLFAVAVINSYFFLALLRGQRSRTNWLGFWLSMTAAYLTHFFAAALGLAQFVTLAFTLRDSPATLRRWLALQVLAFVPLAWWVFRLGTQEVVSFGIAWIPRPGPFDPLLTLANLGTGSDLGAPWAWLPMLALLAGLVLGVREAWTQRRRAEAWPDLYWFWLVMLAILPVYALSQVRPIYADRYFMVCLPGIVLLTVRGWQQVAPRYRQLGLAALVILPGIFQVGIMLAREDNERQSWDEAAAYVAREYRPGDGFVMEVAQNLLPFLRYWDDEAGLRAALYDPATMADAPAGRLWVVLRSPQVDVHREGTLDPFDPFAPRESAVSRWVIDHRAQVVARRDFNGLAVLLVEQPVSTPFPAGRDEE